MTRGKGHDTGAVENEERKLCVIGEIGKISSGRTCLVSYRREVRGNLLVNLVDVDILAVFTAVGLVLRGNRHYCVISQKVGLESKNLSATIRIVIRINYACFDERVTCH